MGHRHSAGSLQVAISRGAGALAGFLLRSQGEIDLTQRKPGRYGLVVGDMPRRAAPRR